MRMTTGEKIAGLEKMVKDLRMDCTRSISNRCNRMEDALQEGRMMAIPVVTDGERQKAQSPTGAFHIVPRDRLHVVKITDVIRLLAEKTGVELVFDTGVPGTLKAAGKNEYPEPEDV